MTEFEPMFGAAQHTPALCREWPEHLPRPKGRIGRRMAEALARAGCETCGGAMPDGSCLVCMSCHSVAPDKAARVARDARPASAEDIRGTVHPGRAGKKAVRLTKKELRALLKDAREGEHDLPAVVEFIRSIEAKVA